MLGKAWLEIYLPQSKRGEVEEGVARNIFTLDERENLGVGQKSRGFRYIYLRGREDKMGRLEKAWLVIYFRQSGGGEDGQAREGVVCFLFTLE